MKLLSPRIFVLLLLFAGLGQIRGVAQEVNNTVLDIDSARTVLSLRKLVPTYTGNVLTIHRDGETETAEIGFKDDTLDFAAIKQFCQSSTCYVQKWYDQSGNNHHATQSNQPNQPIIYTSGEVVTQKKRASMYFDGEGSGRKAVYLQTDAFSIEEKSGENKDSIRVNFTLLIAGGNDKNPGPAVTLVSKTLNQLPAPFDMYNDQFLTGNGAYNSIINQGLEDNLSQPGPAFNVWSFTYTREFSNQALNSNNYSDPGPILSVYLNNGLIKHIARVAKPSTWDSKASRLYIGSRGDYHNYLKGWISEVILYEKYLPHPKTSILDQNEKLRAAGDSLIKHFRIDKSAYNNPNIHAFDVTFAPDRMDLSGLSDLNFDPVASWEADYRGFMCAYSLRKLSSAFVDPILVVRRVSDNALGEVYFDSKGKVSESSDTKSGSTNTTLADFCKGTDCRVARWNNQSGEDSLYLFQKNTSNQPVLVKDGVLNKFKNRTTIFFEKEVINQTFLNSKSFQMNQWYYDKDNDETIYPDLDGLDIYVAGGVTKDNVTNVLFSKSGNDFIYGNPDVPCPSPGIVYNNVFMIGNGSCSHPESQLGCTMTDPMNANSGFSIWNFSAGSIYTKTSEGKNFHPYVSNSIEYYGLWCTPLMRRNGKDIKADPDCIAKYPQTPSQSNSSGRNLDGSLTTFYLGTNKKHTANFTGNISELFLFQKPPWFTFNRQPILTGNMMGYYLGEAGNCLEFDESNSTYVALGDSKGMYAAKSSYTKEAWVKWKKAGNNQQIISCADIFTIKNGYLFAENNRSFTANDGNVTSTTAIKRDVWTHVAVTYNATTSEFQLYINGEEVGMTKSGTPRASAGGQMYLGRHGLQTRYFYKGQMDEVRIWNVCKSAADIKANYNKVVPSGTGLLGYYDFNVGTANGDNVKEKALLNQIVPDNLFYDGVLNGFKLTAGSSSNWKNSTVPLEWFE